ncbi:hypothetical protein PS896_00327 [Pseudomonas fluorescens]|uniref:Uncharacterized protein n=1 Tax=Pseudomonas fluorescens TaxID=294 RepID=A0A5E7GLS8_PSEFL|nr:hypothetical protein PS896_00327 [Pseudomonas fluorescens]
MVEHPGMWDEARSLFQVGTVAGVQRKWPKPVVCGVSTRLGGAWVSASIIGRGLTIEQEQKVVYRAGIRAGTEEVCQINTLLTRFSSVSRISRR